MPKSALALLTSLMVSICSGGGFSQSQCEKKLAAKLVVLFTF